MIEQQNNLFTAGKLSCVPLLATGINHVGTIEVGLNAVFFMVIVLITKEYE